MNTKMIAGGALLPLMLTLVVPGATSIGVNGLLQVENGGEFVLACLGPGFINCSAAAAASVGGCYSIPFDGTPCVFAGGGVVAGLSSLALDGGSATGLVQSAGDHFLNCSWPGASGACADSYVGAGSSCKLVVTGAQGSLTVVDTPGFDVPLVAPQAIAEGKACSLKSRPVPVTNPDELMSHVQSMLMNDLLPQYEIAFEAMANALPPEHQSAFDMHVANLRAAVAGYANGIVVDASYNIHFPSNLVLPFQSGLLMPPDDPTPASLGGPAPYVAPGPRTLGRPIALSFEQVGLSPASPI